jgi:hypothetical protein
MRKKLFYYINALIIALTLANCSTERIDPKNDKESFEKADDFLDSKKAEEQFYEITEEGDGPLVAQQGTKIWLSKDILMYPNGDSVQFPYIIKVVELYTPSDMIYYQMPSVSGNELLTTHGEVRIRAFKNDVELVLRPDKIWALEIPYGDPENDMQLLYGLGENKVNWQDTHQSEFTANAYGYYGEAKQLGWLACSRKLAESLLTTTYSLVSDSLDLGNVTTFIYVPTFKGLTQVYNNTTIPLILGANIKVISMAKQGDQLVSFYQETTVNEDENQLQVILQPVNEATLSGMIESF